MPFVSASCMAVADEYEKNTDLIKEDIKDLRTWIEREQYLPEFKDEMLMHFYHSCYYDMGNTKKCIEAYHTIRINSPEIFSGRDVSKPICLEALDTAYLLVLPARDPSGNVLIYNGLRVTDPAKFNYIECNKCVFMAMDACLETYGPQPGSVLIIDMKGSKLAHLTKMSLSIMRKCLQYQQEANPIRLSAIHIINVTSWIDKLMALIKPFMKKELMSLIHFHADGLESLYKHVPKEYLPKELGGSQKSLEELHVESTAFLKSMNKFFAEEEKLRMSKGSCKKGKKNKKNLKPENIMFEKLEID